MLGALWLVRERPRARIAGTLTGRVLAPDGRPPREAFVRFVWVDRGRPREDFAQTDADGRFEIEVGDARARGDLLASVHRHAFAPAVRTGIEAGSAGLELRLGPPAFFTLDVRDPQGRALDCRPSFHWMLAGQRSQDYPGGAAGPEPLRWARSPVPFVVRLHAQGHAGEWFGPFDPAQVGERLELVLEPLPRVRGRVTHAGGPVAAAKVTLREWSAAGARERVGSGGGEVRTDAAGGFELVYRTPGRYELGAFSDAAGEGRVGPLALDGVQDVDGIELELTTPPGAIEGRVRLPSGHGPAEIWLSVSGRPEYRALRPDGTYLLPGLPPGPCDVRVLAGSETSTGSGPAGENWFWVSHGPDRAPPWLGHERVERVEVPAGGRVRLDIDLASPPACELEGQLRFDGAPARVRPEPRGSGSYFPDDPSVRLFTGASEEFERGCDLARDGRFLLGASAPGTRRLALELGPEGTQEERWLVHDRVELTPGRTPWTLEVATGSLLLRPPDDQHALWGSFSALWKGPGELSIRVESPALDEQAGTRLFRFVPVGTIRVESGEGAAVRECEIRAGETSELVWSE